MLPGHRCEPRLVANPPTGERRQGVTGAAINSLRATQSRLGLSLWTSERFLGVRRREKSFAQCRTDIGHDAFQQCVVGRSVVDDVARPVMEQIGVHTSVHRLVCVGTFGELGPEKSPSDRVEFIRCQLKAIYRHRYPFSVTRDASIIPQSRCQHYRQTPSRGWGCPGKRVTPQAPSRCFSSRS